MFCDHYCSCLNRLGRASPESFWLEVVDTWKRQSPSQTTSLGAGKTPWHLEASHLKPNSLVNREGSPGSQFLGNDSISNQVLWLRLISKQNCFEFSPAVSSQVLTFERRHSKPEIHLTGQYAEIWKSISMLNNPFLPLHTCRQRPCTEQLVPGGWPA